MADIRLASSTFQWTPSTTVADGIKKIFEDKSRNGK
jgi:hypothetical protein